MYKFLGLFAVFTVALGCFPIGDGGDGDDGEISDYAITNSPKFDLSFSPPVEWTAPKSGEPAPGSFQMPNLTDASIVARKMIQSALLEAFVNAGVLPPKNIDYGLDKFDGESINAFKSQENATNGDGIIESGVVANICGKNDTADPVETSCSTLTPFVIDRSFTIKSGPTLTGKQWKEISNKLAKAFIEENVRLDKPIIVSAPN